MMMMMMPTTPSQRVHLIRIRSIVSPCLYQPLPLLLWDRLSPCLYQPLPLLPWDRLSSCLYQPLVLLPWDQVSPCLNQPLVLLLWDPCPYQPLVLLLWDQMSSCLYQPKPGTRRELKHQAGHPCLPFLSRLRAPLSLYPQQLPWSCPTQCRRSSRKAPSMKGNTLHIYA